MKRKLTKKEKKAIWRKFQMDTLEDLLIYGAAIVAALIVLAIVMALLPVID